MAGQYLDVPGVRLPYHADGSLVRWAATFSDTNKAINSAWTSYTAGEIAEMNDGDTTDVVLATLPSSFTGRYLAWLFPQQVNITGHNILVGPSGSAPVLGPLEYSTNTTDGGDGTWSTSSNDNSASTGSALRSISPVNWTGVRAIRVHLGAASGGGTLTSRDLAFYGTWTPATLSGWHPTVDAQIGGADLDFGDIALGAVVVKQFRIKNGNVAQANNVVVSIGDGNAQQVAGLAVSLDNAAYGATRTIPSIAAGAVSPVVYLRRTVLITEASGNIGIAPVKFTATTWS